MKPQVSLVITDLDNTLWDWVRIWCASFGAMLDELVASSGVARETLEREIQAIFQRNGTSEYAFLIQELPSLQAQHPGEDLTVVYASAVDAFREARRAVLELYPTVHDTLVQLGQMGCPVVAYTESMWFYTWYRFSKLGLDGLLTTVYSPPDHATPPDLERRYHDDHYVLHQTTRRHTPPGELKPNPDILLRIVHESGADPQRTVYVGDSLLKDILMAKDACVLDVHAKHGTAQDTEAYEVLRRMTHWSTQDVEREKTIIAEDSIRPTFVLDRCFGQLLDTFQFVAPDS